MSPDLRAIILVLFSASVAIIGKIVWEWLSTGKKSIETDPSSVSYNINPLQKEIIDDLKEEIGKVSAKVDKWAEKLLEHYTTKLESDKIRDDLKNVERVASCNETNIDLMKAQVTELFRVISDLKDRIKGE